MLKSTSQEVLFVWYHKAMARYGFATLIGDYPAGYKFNPNNIPLHLTHVDSFEIGLNAEELASKLGQVLATQRPFSIKATADTMLGPDKDIPVTMLELTPELVSLHKVIMDMLDVEGATLKNPHFHRDDFSPHVSIYGTRRVAIGEEVLIEDVSIGVKTGDGADAVHHIVATVPLANREP
jgi:hypothetical protein